MPDEIHEEETESLRLPRNWHAFVRSTVLQVIGIVRIAMVTGREALIKNGDAPDARIHQLESEVAMLREELRIISGQSDHLLAIASIAMRSPEWWLRWQAAGLLGEFGAAGSVTIPQLRRLLDDDHPIVRRAAPERDTSKATTSHAENASSLLAPIYNN